MENSTQTTNVVNKNRKPVDEGYNAQIKRLISSKTSILSRGDMISKIKPLIRATDTALTIEDCRVLVLKRLKAVQKGDEAKIQADVYTAFVVLNAWCYMASDNLKNMSHQELAQRIRIVGIDAAILEAEEYRTELLNSERVIDGYNPTDLIGSKYLWWATHVEKQFFENIQERWNVLEILAFPKRMRLETTDYSFMYEDYLNGNRKCFYYGKSELFSADGEMDWDEWKEDHPQPPKFLRERLAYYVSLITKNWKQDLDLFQLPPGSSYESHKTYFEKFKEVLKSQQWLRDHGINIPWVFGFSGTKIPSTVNRYSIVPKNFKTGRGIAPEPVSRQVLGYTVDSGLRQCLLGIGFDLNDQSPNQIACCDALVNDLATCDMKSASDSLSFGLVKDAFSMSNPRLWELLLDCRTDSIKVKGKIYPNNRFCTMGNAITFSVETTIFVALAAIAITLTEPKMSFKRAVKLINVYGDDIILPNRYYDTFANVCRMFGLTLNAEKSFTNGLYRESCGFEAISDIGCTEPTLVKSVIAVQSGIMLKWPRGTSNIPIAELVSMQHKCVAYPMMNYFISRVILDVFPDMTSSEVGSPYQDIWYDKPFIQYKGSSPYAKFEDGYYITRRPDLYQNWISPQTIEDESSQKGSYRMKSSKHESQWHKINHKVPTFESTLINHKWDEMEYTYNKYVKSQLVKLDAPHDDNYEVHYCITSVPGIKKVPDSDRDLVELLAYLMKLGNGVNHINASQYTKQENMIIERRDFYHERKIEFKPKRFPM
jgi:hypothetical protein